MDTTLTVAVLTYNRKALLRKTLQSLAIQDYPHRFVLVDNGSTDGTADLVERSGGIAIWDGDHTVGHGMNVAIAQALARGTKYVLFTADDYEYQPGALARLVAFWDAAPCEVALCCCNLEPDYPWNQVWGVLESGGQRALMRMSVPGSNWSFRAADWPQIGPLREVTGGEDLEVCKRLLSVGRKLCALDLAEHIGERKSAWGNQSWTVGRPLDRARLGM